MMSGPLLNESGKVVLYDTVNSYYAGLVRIALAENSIEFVSRYVNMQATEQIEPWYMKINPLGQVPALRTESGEIVNESRIIVSWAYKSKETSEEKEVLDQLYSEDPGSLAWLSGFAKIPLLKIMNKLPLQRLILPKMIGKLQAANPDLHEAYEKKREAMSKKHTSKRIEVVQGNIQRVVNWLEEKRQKSSGPWLLGSDFGRADALVSAYLQWISCCNEYGAAPISLPAGLMEYLALAKSRPAFHQAIGKYGNDAFVLTMFKKKNRKAGCVILSLAVLVVLAVAVSLPWLHF